ncbi:flavin oxidoreductase [Sedimentitalea sp. CY04]|uniref:Flavin oxidoreductase n=1 Tax=Parasedimentitalea denitrificans TaxID=2211118 RepID=A0ABX0WCI0_9RHOB|nr:flavin reductase family protein [Sedimentitalea sp. CY04]NIZ63415.1 flavin oxidoreductase [Sedimentitalea sp. CY04]
MPDGALDMPVNFAPEAGNARQLRDAFGRFATGVTVVTALGEDGPVGIVVNSFSSVSLDPALVLWSPSKTSRRFRYFEAADHYAIHVLSADQAELCQGFSKDAHAFDGSRYQLNANGVPLIEDCLARFECTRTATYDGGDHLIVVGRVDQAEMRDGDALTFYAGKFGLASQP